MKVWRRTLLTGAVLSSALSFNYFACGGLAVLGGLNATWDLNSLMAFHPFFSVAATSGLSSALLWNLVWFPHSDSWTGIVAFSFIMGLFAQWGLLSWLLAGGRPGRAPGRGWLAVWAFVLMWLGVLSLGFFGEYLRLFISSALG